MVTAGPAPISNKHSDFSTLRESIIEHAFIAELLRFLWNNHTPPFEVAKPAVDDSGYDLIIATRPLRRAPRADEPAEKAVLRHIQLKVKSAKKGMKLKASSFDLPVNIQLEDAPSGCVVLIACAPDLSITNYYWHGPRPQSSLSGLRDRDRAFRPATKKVRRNTVKLGRTDFEELGPSIERVAERLFEI